MMSNNLSTLCSEFTEKLASKDAVPGGGGAAALCGALAAALCSMVANYTVGKKGYESCAEEIKILLEKAEKYRLNLLELIDRDAKGFAPLAEAYSIPKDNPKREDFMRFATLRACVAPEGILDTCCAVVRLLERMLKIGNRSLFSDIGCAALMCRAALESAAINIYVNTASLRGDTQADELNREVDELVNEYVPRAVAVSDAVMATLIA